MTARFQRSMLSPTKGTIRSTDCDGSGTNSISSQSYAAFRYIGHSKSSIVLSNFHKPTAYRNYWIQQAKQGEYGYTFKDKSCNILHPTLPGYYTIAKATGMPYFPKRYYFALYGSVDDFAYSSDQRLTPNARFAKIKSICENECLGKLKAQKMAVPVSIAEGKQTLQLAMDLTKDVAATLVHVARGISNPRSLIDQFHKLIDKYGFKKNPRIPRKKRALRKFHNGMYDAFKRKRIEYPDPTLLSDATSRWLQYRYGIIPALSDAEAIHDIYYVHALEPVTTGYQSVRYRIKDTFSIGGDGNVYSPGTQSVTGESKVVAEVKLFYKVASPAKDKIRRLGMSLRDVPATLYELIPFSFVLDWFIDFGGYFNALSASYGLSFSYGYFAVKEVVEDKTWFHTSVTGEVTPPGTENGAEAKRKYGCFNRTVYSSFPSPNLPSFTFPFGGLFDKRLADSISLFTQLRRKGTVVV